MGNNGCWEINNWRKIIEVGKKWLWGELIIEEKLLGWEIMVVGEINN